MRNFNWLIILFLMIVFQANGQERPIFNHYYANPFLYNPAFAGEDYRPSFYFTHRRQWMGFEGAPVTSNLTFDTPLGEKFAFGLQFSNDSRGLLNSSSGLITVAYKAMFNPEHFIKFGLSGGLINRKLADWDEIMNDPRYQDDEAILKLLDKTMYLDGRFGVNYHLKGLNLGFTMPRLFKNELFGIKSFNNGEINPLNSYQVMLHYKSYNKTSPINFEPYLVYRIQENGVDNQFEGAGILRIKNIVWLGGIYRQNIGTTAVGGLTIGDSFHFGYSYDIGNGSIGSFSKGTHEIMLKLNFGEEKRPKKRERQIVQKEKDPFELYQENKKNDPTNDETPNNDQLDHDGKVSNYKGPTEVNEGNHQMDLKKGYYVVVGVFSGISKAQNYSNYLYQNGYFTKVGFSSQANYYFVYMYHSDTDKKSADAFTTSLNQKQLFKGSWVLTVK